jgi:hypothetical protein
VSVLYSFYFPKFESITLAIEKQALKHFLKSPQPGGDLEEAGRKLIIFTPYAKHK